MAVEVCRRCDRYVDLDWNVEDIIYVDNVAVCVDCLTEAEQDWLDEHDWPAEMPKLAEAPDAS